MAVTDTQPVSTENLSGAIDAIKRPGALLDVMYPIGAIYLSVSGSDPGSLFGGTWQRIEDVFLLAAGSTYSAGSTGGEATHKLTVNEMPAHSHNITMRISTSGSSTVSSLSRADYNINTTSVKTEETGGGAAHNNLPPYLTVYAWKRTK